MRLLLAIGGLAAVMAFCGLGERLKQMSGADQANGGNPPKSGIPNTSAADKPTMTAKQQEIADAGKEIKWDEQGITWRLPASWKKTQSLKESLNYSSPDNAFLIASISVMPDNFPSESSINATYESALEQLKQGKYEAVRWLEIDGVKGVEWIEAMPEDKSGARRHQWIAFRRYLGQNQQLNIMFSTAGSKFDAHRDEFAVAMYSMKIPKG